MVVIFVIGDNGHGVGGEVMKKNIFILLLVASQLMYLSFHLGYKKGKDAGYSTGWDKGFITGVENGEYVEEK